MACLPFLSARGRTWRRSAAGGILSVGGGQVQASLALGIDAGAGDPRTVLPQAIKAIVPPTGNQAIGMLKGTAIVSVIGIHDLLAVAELIYSRNVLVIELLSVDAILYVTLTTIASIGQYYLERHFRR